MIQTARERRLKQMAEKGYLTMSPEERATRLLEGLDALKKLGSTFDPDTLEELKKKGAEKERYE